MMAVRQIGGDVTVVDEEVERLQERATDCLARIDQALGEADKLGEWMAQQIEVLRVWEQARAGRGNGSGQLSSGV